MAAVCTMQPADSDMVDEQLNEFIAVLLITDDLVEYILKCFVFRFWFFFMILLHSPQRGLDILMLHTCEHSSAVI